MKSRRFVGAQELILHIRKIESRLGRRADGAEWTRLMGVDPGEVSGVAVAWYHRPSGRFGAWAETLVSSFGGKRELQAVSELLEIAEQLQGGPLFVAIEDFTVTRVDMSAAFLSPVRIGRRLEWALISGGIARSVEFYLPARKAEFKDDRLKSLGMYTPGPDHMRDATRHLLILRKNLAVIDARDTVA